MKNHEQDGLSQEELVQLVSNEIIPRLTAPSDDPFGELRLQQMRRGIARDWKNVFCKLDNLGWLAGWLINECAQERDASEIHYPLCHLAFDSNRSIFAIVNQLRSGLWQETFGYLRTMHETFVRSRFLSKHSENDPDLPGRFLYYTNSTYLEFYRRFAQMYDHHLQLPMWVETQQHFQSKFGELRGGDYGWACPLIKLENGDPKQRPTFRDLMEDVDVDSAFSRLYYDVSTSKTHGELIWNPLMVFPDAREFSFDSFGVEGIGLVLDLMIPMFKEILRNAGSSCITPKHAVVMSVVNQIIEDISNSVAGVKASNPEVYFSAQY